jgi:high-affinity Fe2+/Pb2+ permease
MDKSKIYFAIGFIAFQLGACMIHIGLGVMLLGAWMLLYSYIEFEDNYKDGDEND